MVISITLSDIMALKCSGVHGRTEAELAFSFFLLCTNFANYGSFCSHLAGSTKLAVNLSSVRNGEK